MASVGSWKKVFIKHERRWYGATSDRHWKYPRRKSSLKRYGPGWSGTSSHECMGHTDELGLAKILPSRSLLGALLSLLYCKHTTINMPGSDFYRFFLRSRETHDLVLKLLFRLSRACARVFALLQINDIPSSSVVVILLGLWCSQVILQYVSHRDGTVHSNQVIRMF